MPSTAVNPYAGKPLATPVEATNFRALSPESQYYINKKMGYDFANQEKLYGADSALWGINDLLKYKGGNQISDWSQADSALAPLIAKRNAGGLGNALGGIGKIALPIALSFLAPGLGTAIGAGLGLGTGTLGAAVGSGLLGAGTSGLTSALTGGKVFKDALTGGLTAGATAGLAQGLGNSAGSTLAETTGKVGMQGPTAGSGVLGSLTSGTNAASTGLRDVMNFGKDALSGIREASDSMGQKINSTLGIDAVKTGEQGGSLFDTIGDKINSATGLPVLNTSTVANSAAGQAAAANALPTSTVGGSAMGNPLTTALSGYMEYKTQNDIANKLKKSQQLAMAQMQPYTNAGASANAKLQQLLAQGFNPEDLASDSGYQFRLAQGQRSLGQSLAARGLGQSGAALKAAQEYGQNFANQEYTDAYNRWLANNQQLAGVANLGANAAKETGDYMSNIGAVGAQGMMRKNNALSSALSGILSGRGIIDFDDETGKPIYG